MTKIKKKHLDILKKMPKDRLDKMILEGLDQAEANAKQYLRDINIRNQKILQNKKIIPKKVKLDGQTWELIKINEREFYRNYLREYITVDELREELKKEKEHNKTISKEPKKCL